MTPEIPDEEHESETERDGLLSYAGEWHALVLGFAHGARDPYKLAPDELPQGDSGHAQDARDEPAYYSIGFVAGTATQLGLLIMAGWLGGAHLGVF